MAENKSATPTSANQRDRMEELRRLDAEAEAGGGPERREREHKAGKLSARERVDLLLDEGTFEVYSREIGVGKIDSAKVGFDAGFSACFHPDFVLIENFRQIQKRDRPSGFFGRRLIRKLILLILNIRKHRETFPHSTFFHTRRWRPFICSCRLHYGPQ